MKAELKEMVAEAKVARSIVGKLCSEGRYPKMSIPLQESDEDQVLCRVCKSVVKLVELIESRDAEIHAMYAPVVEAVENDHVLVCQAVTLLNNGETHRAHALLRQWLADWDIRTALAAIKEIQNA